MKEWLKEFIVMYQDWILTLRDCNKPYLDKFIEDHIRNNPFPNSHPLEVTDETEWFRKSIAEEMTRKELEDRLVEQHEIIIELKQALARHSEIKDVDDDEIKEEAELHRLLNLDWKGENYGCILLAEHLHKWMMKQKFGNEGLLHAAVCCDFVGYVRFQKALSEQIETYLKANKY